MSLNSTPRTWVTGEVVTAAEMNAEVRDALTGIQAALTAYTPTVANMTLGNGTITGRWTRFGKNAFVRINLVSGTTTTYTATNVTISLPAAAHATGVQAVTAFMNNNVAGLGWIAAGASVATPMFSSSSTNPLLTGIQTGTFNPGAGTGGYCLLEGWYELA